MSSMSLVYIDKRMAQLSIHYTLGLMNEATLILECERESLQYLRR